MFNKNINFIIKMRQNQKQKILLSLVPTAAISFVAQLRRRRWMLWELSKVRRPTFIASDEYGDEYRNVLMFIAKVHRSMRWAFFFVGKDVKIKYTSSNFSLYLYPWHGITFSFVSKIVIRKKCAKAKYLKSESNYKNWG